MRILVIDDDTELATLLGEFLRREGFEADFAYDGVNGLKTALRGEHALVVLDVMLPGIDGFEVLRRLRQTSQIPVVMLTARSDDIDRIVGLEIGADDYLAKPFNPRELAARIRAVLRRAEPRPNEGRIEVNDVILDPASRQVIRDGQPVDLTTVEFQILDQLMRAAGRVLTRDQLMEALYGRKSGPFDRAMDMHISHLRKKLESAGRSLIKTVRGVGYQFVK